MKKAGIVVDNYKLPFFEKRLTAEGYEYNTAPFTPSTTTITVMVEKAEISYIGRMCKELELKIKHSN